MESGKASVVTPCDKFKGWEFDQIVSDIIEKNSKRAVCPSCAFVPEGDNTAKMCIYYDYENQLIEESERELVNPKDMYKEDPGKGARLACYKLYTLLEHGRLGRSRRKPLPACVEARIKMLHQSPTFTGYKGAKEKSDDDSNDNDSDSDTWEGTASPLRTYKKQKFE